MNKIKIGKFFVFTWTMFLLIFFTYHIVTGPSKAIKEKEAFVKDVVQSAGGAGVVLSACRKLLSEVKPFEGEDAISIGEDGFSESQVPRILRDMHPKNMTVSENCLYIQLPIKNYRLVFLCAFRENEKQYGTSAITNGLWVWCGGEKRTGIGEPE